MRLLALLASLAIALSSSVALAEGENGPMIGGALIATRAPDTELAGAQLELAFWHGPIGLAIEGTHQTGLESGVTTAGGSLRLLMFRQLTPSLLDPNEDVELGLEAQGIVEHSWWHDDQAHPPTSYGAGLVLRLRGGTDFTNVLAESRLFVRAMWSRSEDMDAVARSTMPMAERGVLIVIGLGAVFGSGDPTYAKQFRRRAFDNLILPVN